LIDLENYLRLARMDAYGLQGYSTGFVGLSNFDWGKQGSLYSGWMESQYYYLY